MKLDNVAVLPQELSSRRVFEKTAVQLKQKDKCITTLSATRFSGVLRPSGRCLPHHLLASLVLGDRAAVPLEELAPVLLLQLKVKPLHSLLNPLPRRIALLVGHAFDLIEPSDRIADMAGINQRLFPLFGERKGIIRQLVTLFIGQLGHGFIALLQAVVPSVNTCMQSLIPQD